MCVRKDVTLVRKRHMSIVKVRNDDVFQEEKCDVAIQRPHKHVNFLIK
jgi:hypothetical protein